MPLLEVATTQSAAPASAPTLLPDTSPAINLCGIASPNGGPPGAFETPAANSATAPTAPANPTTTVLSNANLYGFTVAAGKIYARTANQILVSSESGNLLSSFAMPNRSSSAQALGHDNEIGTVVVDPLGNIYFAEFNSGSSGFTLVSMSPTGAINWSFPIGNISTIYPWHDGGGNWALAIDGDSSSNGLVSESGQVVASTQPLADGVTEVSPTPSGGLITTNQATQSVSIYSATGAPISAAPSAVPSFSSASTSNSPGSAMPFGSLGGAVEIGSTIYVDDYASNGSGLDLFTTTGVLEGAIAPPTLGTDSFNSPLAYDSRARLFWMAGNSVVAASAATLNQLISVPATPPQEDGFGDYLGAGAGLSTPATANYFAAGSTPSVTATFEPWWQSYGDPLELSYWVANGDQVQANATPAPTIQPLSWSGVSAGSPLSFNLRNVSATPGVYLVNADLIDTATGRTIGSTCLTYSVGSPGDTLNFAGLSAGSDYGGPAPVRGVELAAELGTGLYREQLNLATLLPNCDASAPSAATCGPAGLTGWSNYDPAIEQAAAAAASLGVNFEVQVGQSGFPVDAALVQDNDPSSPGGSLSYWKEDAQAIATHLASSAPDLEYVEAWNEPNNGTFSGPVYVTQCLKPFFQAVQAANATDGQNLQVVGGTVVGMDLGYWNAIADAGGFSYMNVAAIHPYPGYNRSFEEEGTLAAIQALRGLMTSNGAGAMPIFITESGWWSDGEQSFYDVGNWAPREWILLKSLGVSNWNYFVSEGEFDGTGSDFSLIDASDGDNYVKPGAIGLMTASNLLGDRPFLRSVSLGIPHSYGELFGPGSGAHGGSNVLVVWSDDLNTPAEIDTTSSSSISVSTTEALRYENHAHSPPRPRRPSPSSEIPALSDLPRRRLGLGRAGGVLRDERLLRKPRPLERRGNGDGKLHPDRRERRR